MGGGGPFGLMMGCKRREYKTCWSYIHILYVCICMVHGNVRACVLCRKYIAGGKWMY